MRTRFCATIRRPAFSMIALIAPVRLRAVASGLRIEKVRSTAIGLSFTVIDRRVYRHSLEYVSRGGLYRGGIRAASSIGPARHPQRFVGPSGGSYEVQVPNVCRL